MEIVITYHGEEISYGDTLADAVENWNSLDPHRDSHTINIADIEHEGTYPDADYHWEAR